VRFLLDTCAVSELRLPDANAGFRTALSRIYEWDLYISVVVVGEIAKGIGLLSAGRKKKDLTSWLDNIEKTFGDRVLGVDLETAKLWGDLTARARKAGLVIPAADGLLAATAIQNEMRIITRNVKHFEIVGVAVFNPWT
jgi:predicted nucleic acid-binding protein